MLAGARILIVEDEFLIALDIQRVVEDAGAHQSVLARTFAKAGALAARFESFDLAIITSPDAGEAAAASRLIDAGVAIVICSAAHADLSGTALAKVELVYKPFLDEDLVAACERALVGRPAR